MYKEFVFTYTNPELNVINAEYKISNLIEDPFPSIYPMTLETQMRIINGFGQTLKYNRSGKIGVSNIMIFYDEDFQTGFLFFNDGNAVKKPSIQHALKTLQHLSLKAGIIIAPKVSKGCREFVEMFSSSCSKSYGIIEIEELMTPESATTVPSLLGRYANQSMGKADEPKQVVVISVPAKGFPSLGKEGKLTSQDIYDILESKIEASGNTEKEKGFDLLLNAFYKFVEIINSGKYITANRWNEILDEENVIEFIENMEEE